jgi:hypothetical protein
MDHPDDNSRVAARRNTLRNLSTAGFILATAPSAFGQDSDPGPLYASQFGVNSINPDNSTQLTKAINAAISGNQQLVFDAGVFSTNTVTIGAGHYNFQGMGVGNTIFQPLSGGNTVFQFSNSGYNSGNIGGFSISGSLAGSGDGILLASGNYDNFELHDIQIIGMGGVGLHEAIIPANGAAFNVTYRNILCDNNLGHQFDLLGANTNTLISCYAARCPTSGTAGFRIRSNYPTLINCTGLNRDQNNTTESNYWGIFGNSISLGDPTNALCTPTLIGCNVEGFNVCGLRCRGQVPILINTVIGADAVAASGGTGYVTALTLDSEPSNQGQFVNGTVYTAGARWLDNQPFHSRLVPPFALYQVGSGTTLYQYYDDQYAATYTMGALGSANTPPGSLTMSPYYSSLAATQMFIGTPGQALAGIYTGSGAPTFVAVQGSLYLRTDGGASTSLYVNTSGSTTWSAV